MLACPIHAGVLQHGMIYSLWVFGGCSTLSPNNFTHCVKIFKSSVT